MHVNLSGTDDIYLKRFPIESLCIHLVWNILQDHIQFPLFHDTPNKSEMKRQDLEFEISPVQFEFMFIHFDRIYLYIYFPFYITM